MSYADKTLSCRECGQEFVWTAGEQEFYASRGLMHPPSRCPSCRRARKMGGAPQAKVVMYKRPFGYRGSIYADTDVRQPQANVTRLELPGGPVLPSGFYYLWNP